MHEEAYEPRRSLIHHRSPAESHGPTTRDAGLIPIRIQIDNIALFSANRKRARNVLRLYANEYHMEEVLLGVGMLCERGRRRKKVEPTPSVDTNQMSPPCCQASSRLR
jgi:hypothetical protein